MVYSTPSTTSLVKPDMGFTIERAPLQTQHIHNKFIDPKDCSELGLVYLMMQLYQQKIKNVVTKI